MLIFNQNKIIDKGYTNSHLLIALSSPSFYYSNFIPQIPQLLLAFDSFIFNIKVVYF
jgi:hypothetical protein